MKFGNVEEAAAEIARRFDAIYMRTEDRLNEEFLARVVRETVTQVLNEMNETQWRAYAEEVRKALRGDG